MPTCGNGAHHNPEVEVVKAFASARLQGIGGSAPLGPPTPFKFWFTSGPTTPDSTANTSRQTCVFSGYMVKRPASKIRASAGETRAWAVTAKPSLRRPSTYWGRSM